MPESRRVIDIREMGDELKKASYAIEVRRYDLAIEIMHRVLSTQPENSMAFYTLARAYSLKKQNPKALEAIRETLRLDASNSYAHTLYGGLLMETGKEHYAQAEEELLEGLRLGPSIVYTHYIYARFCLEHRPDIPKAKEHCSRALELDPADVKLHWLMGRIFIAEKNFAQAETTFRQGLSLDPENAQIHNAYGALLFNNQHRPQDAFEHFRVAITQRPDDPDYRKNFLLALKAKNKFFWLFWNYGLMRRRLGKMYLLVIVAIGILTQLSLQLARSTMPVLAPVAGTIICIFVVFYAYMFAINPLFNFFIKRGWLK